MTDDEIRRELRRFITRLARGKPFRDDENLWDLGFMTSMNMMQLEETIHARFKVGFDRIMGYPGLQTVNEMVAAISAQLALPPPPKPPARQVTDEEIRRELRKFLARQANGKPFRDDENLWVLGFMTTMNMMQFQTHIETRFDIAMREILGLELHTVDQIVASIQRSRAERG